ncbi:uncharacterized protein LOC112906347 [Agrilus planipennis]|uniref:Uncharacterized protein LOC112906347 n=1 Tax=Agrilus planipennis TaxID=224129 RepID=A0A7F5RJE0_AGRPL|nr:uncharacterized protein LOC112906347 [Agrilus planipennis]
MTLKRQSQVFTKEEELHLAKYLEKASKLHHGLSSLCVRQLAYQLAIQNQKADEKICKWANNIASYDWFYGFMKRNTQLSLRVPEATSLSRSTSFNKHNIGCFFENLQKLLVKYHFGPEAIWNIDETGLSTVHKPKKIVATKGVKQIGKMTPGERGELVTACCATNAMRGYIPPFLIFPRKNWQDRMLNGAPAGTNASVFPSGWMTAENFIKFLQHFKKYTKCSVECPMLIIMDNHDSHISIESLNFAKENGISLSTIPPHTSHNSVWTTQSLL